MTYRRLHLLALVSAFLSASALLLASGPKAAPAEQATSNAPSPVQPRQAPPAPVAAPEASPKVKPAKQLPSRARIWLT